MRGFDTDKRPCLPQGAALSAIRGQHIGLFQYLLQGTALSTMGAVIRDHAWGQPCLPIA